MVTIFFIVLGLWGIGQVCIGVVWIAVGILGLIAQATRRDEGGR